MRRVFASLIAAIIFTASSPANACLPPMLAFARGSVRLDASDRSEIARAVQAFRNAQPGARLRMSIYLDEAGAANVNRRMAQRRGKMVRAALTRQGVPADFIDIEILPAAGDGYTRAIWMDVTEAHAGCW